MSSAAAAAAAASASASAPALYEATRLRHQRLLVAHARARSGSGTGDDDEHDAEASSMAAAGRMIASRASVASVLCRAIAANASSATAGSNAKDADEDNMEEEEEEEEELPKETDVRHIMALLETTLPLNDATISSGETEALARLAARSNRDHPVVVHNATSSANGTSRSAPAPALPSSGGGATANDFFAEYPDCIRADYAEDDNSSCSSSSSSSSSVSGGEEEEVENDKDRKKGMMMMKVESSNGNDDDVMHVQTTRPSPPQRPQQQLNPYQQQQQQQLNPTPSASSSQPHLNPYLYGGGGGGSAGSQGSNGLGSNHASPHNNANTNAINSAKVPLPSVSAPAPAPAMPPAQSNTSMAKGWNDYEPPARAPNGYRHNGGGGSGGPGASGAIGSGGGGSSSGKANPFQTAREFAGTSGGGGDYHNNNNNNNNNNHNGDDGYGPAGGINNNSNGRNHSSYGTNPYGGGGNPYGNNPYQTTTANGPANQSASSAQQLPSASTLNRPEISAGLKRKFQPPKRTGGAGGAGGSVGKDTKMVGRKVYGGGNNNSNRGGGSGGAVARPSSSGGRAGGGGNQDDEEELPEELQGLDKELVNKIMNEIVDNGESVTFDDIAGLADAKRTIMELVCWPMKRPDLFTGLRRGPNGLLLFGPPGTGKTLIGKAIAHESGACFFSISSSSLTSKWIGEGEKLVRTLFAVAAYREPAVVFIDEIDSLLTARKADENEASRRIKTEFLVQLDGTGTSGQGRLLCIGATNRPHELDDAARRRFVKRLYIPLPEQSDREILLRTLLKKNTHSLTDEEITKLSSATHGYSGADLKALCNDASMGPIRDLGARAMEIAAEDVPPISYKHFRRSLKGMNPSVSEEDLDDYIKFNDTYGNKHREDNDDDDDDDDSD